MKPTISEKSYLNICGTFSRKIARVAENTPVRIRGAEKLEIISMKDTSGVQQVKDKIPHKILLVTYNVTDKKGHSIGIYSQTLEIDPLTSCVACVKSGRWYKSKKQFSTKV